MSVFGWCSSGFHADYEGEWSAPCKGSYRRIVKEVKKRGRKKVETVLIDEIRECGCYCHTPQEEKPKRGRKKK